MEGDAKAQQYVLLAKGARGLALVDLILKATSEPGVYGFREILDLPNVQEMSKGDLAPSHALLELFAYGTWSEYRNNPGAFPELSHAQRGKLKQLTLISLALERKVIPYQVLLQHLEICSVRQLEDFIIAEGFYTNIIAGKMDQRKGYLQIHNTIGRDVKPQDLPVLEAGLQKWVDVAERVLQNIEEQIQCSSSATEQHRTHRSDVGKKIEETTRNLKAEVKLAKGDLEEAVLASYDYMDEDRELGTAAGGPAHGERKPKLGGRPKRRLR